MVALLVGVGFFVCWLWFSGILVDVGRGFLVCWLRCAFLSVVVVLLVGCGFLVCWLWFSCLLVVMRVDFGSNHVTPTGCVSALHCHV